MTINFNCVSCHTVLQVGEESLGKRARCPRCETIMPIPELVDNVEVVEEQPQHVEQHYSSDIQSDIQFNCNSCGTVLVVGHEYIGKHAQCHHCKNIVPVPTPAHIQNSLQTRPARGGLTGGQRLGDLAKTYGLLFVICFVFMFLFAPIGVIAFTALLLFLLMTGPAFLFSGKLNDWWHRDDPNYREYRQGGGDPFLDNVWLLRKSETEYKLPYPEPGYTTFVPPRTWAYQCLNCYARLDKPTGKCWYCEADLGRFPMVDNPPSINMQL